MLTPKQTKILGSFLMQPYQEITYKQIKDHSREKSNSVIQKAIAKYLAEGIVLKRDVGNIILYRLNLRNQKTISYLTVLIEEQLQKSVRICLQTIKEETSDVTFKSIVIFGSYARNEHKEKSDMDIAVFVRNAEDKRKAELSLKSAEMKCVLSIDAHVFTKEEMLQMLKDKYENLGKQIAKKHLVVQNPEIFYSIIEEGIKNGFNIIS